MDSKRQEAYELWDSFDPVGRTHYRYTVVSEDEYTPPEPVYCRGQYVNHTTGVSYGFDAEAQREIDNAFTAWADVAGVSFEKVAYRNDLSTDEAEIFIAFDDYRNSDGRGGQVAEAVVAKEVSDLCQLGFRLEGNETLIFADPADYRSAFGSSGGRQATETERAGFYNTMLHEIGHGIGIGHSDVAGTVMAGNEGGGHTPYTQYGRGVRATLTQDDINAAQALYGPARAAPAPSDVHYTNRVIGTPGVDRLYGTSANDVMSGGAGRDLLAGGDGNDLLLGGHEGATLFGQGGADTFVFTGGRNWFMDFDPAEGDRIAGLTAAALNEGTANGTMGVYQQGEIAKN